MSNHEPITLYVDGACKGNPGLGGWGVYIEYPDGQVAEYCGGEANTTNNRMELQAAIQGLEHTPRDQPVLIWTDSSYVQQGISQWIHGWKSKNWRKADGKPVMNADLWQQLDQAVQGRQIDWRWIKGHAGHAGNERADELANQGTRYVDQGVQTLSAPASTRSADTPELPDWLRNDPLGFDALELIEPEDPNEWMDEPPPVDADTPPPQIPATALPSTPISSTNIVGRQLILDTETTGFDPAQGDRIIEIGVLEMIERKLTGNKLHLYLNPQRPVGDSVNVHGLTDEFLADKPLFASVAQQVSDFLQGAELIAHNANFDMNFLEAELKRCGLPALAGRVTVTDTLAMAKRKYPGQKNSLDALVKRCEIKPRDRHYHGALLDAEILADVYLVMTGGQVSLDMGMQDQGQTSEQRHRLMSTRSLPVVRARPEEASLHHSWLDQLEQGKSPTPTLWRQLGLI
jgi:ribonuclease HI/DNA polymerase-3 subunit epsilon